MSALLATLPLGASAILTGGFANLIGPRAAGWAIAIAFLIAPLSILGWPPLPPRSSLQKIVYISIIGLVLGIAFDLLRERAPVRCVATAWSAIIVVWLGWPQVIGVHVLDLLRLAVVWLAGIFVFSRLLTERANGIVAPTLVLVGGLGLSAVAFIGLAASLSQLAAAVAAATGGFLLWNWPKQRHVFAIAAVFGAATPLVAVAATTALFTRTNPLALTILLAVFIAGCARPKLPLKDSPAWESLVFGTVAALPVLVAVIVAVVAAPGSTD